MWAIECLWRISVRIIVRMWEMRAIHSAYGRYVRAVKTIVIELKKRINCLGVIRKNGTIILKQILNKQS